MSLSSTTLSVAELYKVVLGNGYTASAYFTNHDTSISYNGATYQPIPIARTNISYHSDLQVDKVDVSFGLVGLTIGDRDLTIPQVIRADFLKNAHLYIYLYDTANSALLSTLFEGFLTGDISYNQGVVTCSFGSILDKLQQKFPHLIYSEFCNHNLFDTYCGLIKADYKSTGTVIAGTTKSLIYANVFSFSIQSEGYWDKGEIMFTSGDNENISRTIKKHYSGYVDLMSPFPFFPKEDDTFDVYPGCDKSGETCDTKFSNYDNFFGFETIPKPEVLYG